MFGTLWNALLILLVFITLHIIKDLMRAFRWNHSGPNSREIQDAVMCLTVYLNTAQRMSKDTKSLAMTIHSTEGEGAKLDYLQPEGGAPDEGVGRLP